jgi:hypothetical protein
MYTGGECMAFIFVDSDGSLAIQDIYDKKTIISDIGGWWDTVSKVWRIAFTLYNLDYLLDKLEDPVVSDDMAERVEQQIEKEKELSKIRLMSKQDVPVNLKISGLNANLYNYQKLGVVFSVINGSGTLIADEMGLGKAQPLDSKILTPDGWKCMGDINVGDTVIDESGKGVRVMGVFPQGKKDVFRVRFSDDSSTECCDEHLWQVNTACRKNRGNKPFVFPLREIVRLGLTRRNGKNGIRNNWYIPIASPTEFSRSGDLDIVPPYIMGILLGDGGLSCQRLGFSSADQDILDKALKLMPVGWKFRKTSADLGYELCFPGANQINPVHALFRRHGLKGKMTYEKHIPKSYLFAPVRDRMELLRGLMDTDGTVGLGERGNVAQFCTSSKHLRDGMVFLCRSLGGVAHVSSKIPFYKDKDGNKVICRRAWIITLALPSGVHPFSLARKNELYPNERGKYEPIRAIVSVKKVGNKLCQCICVDNESGLYITDDFIVTHNSLQAIATAMYLKSQGKVNKALIVVPASLKYNWPIEIEKFTSEKYVVIDGEPDERIAQWLRDDVFFYIVNYELILEDLFGGKELKEKVGETADKKQKRQARILEVKKRERILAPVRTRMWDFIVVDEIHYIKSHSSRRSRNVKMLRGKFRMGLTGTPLDGRLEELHSVMSFIAPGLLGSKSRFFQMYVETDFWGKVTGYKKLGEITKRIELFLIRRLKKDVLKDLPDKIYQNRIITMSDDENKIYKKLADGGHEATENEQAIVACIRCKQFCNWPPMIDVNCQNTSKMQALKDILDEVIIQNGHKALIFSQYKEMLDIIALTLDGMGLKYLRIDGDVDKKERVAIQAKFNEDKTIDLVIGTEAMSLGLNLVGADYVINYDDNWSPSVMSQREDRSHRINQKNVVNVINFICKNTIEERIRDVLYGKNKITAEVLGDHTDEMILRRLNPVEIAKLL